MSCKTSSLLPGDVDHLRRRSVAESTEACCDPEHPQRLLRLHVHPERLCLGPQHADLGVATPSPDASAQHFCHFTPKCLLAVHRGAHCTSPTRHEEGWHDGTSRTTIRVENEVEAHREANNYKFGFRKWKGNVTEKPIEDRSDIDKELHTDLSIVKQQEASVVTFGNIAYVFLFGWWVSLFYILICPVMFLTICGASYGKVCFKLARFFIWPFGNSIEKASSVVRRSTSMPTNCEIVPQERDAVDCEPLLVSSPLPVEVHVPALPPKKPSKHWGRVSTYIWLFLGYPVLAVVHSLACVLSWMLVFTIPVAKMNGRVLTTVLLMAPEEVQIHKLDKTVVCETRVILCCYQAFNMYYYKYTVQGINIFALNLLPLVFMTLVIGYADRQHKYFSAETIFTIAITSIIPLSYYIGMGIASLSAQSNFAVGAVVNATFGSIAEMTFYITALLRGHRAGSKCYEEIVKAALTGTLLGCILFIPGICMTVGGIKHSEQRFNSRSAGVGSALLFISIGGVFAPTLFSKVFGNLVCESCSNIPGNASAPFICKDCHYYVQSQTDPHLILSNIEPLVYTISVLLPASYLIGLIFTLKTHSHIYDIQISDGHGGHVHGHHFVHWSRWRALVVLIAATVLMTCCADLCTENIEPILTHSTISQYFIGVTVLAMVPELPEIVNGIQFALQNNISLSLEVGSCIAVQVCMIQIPLLILFNAFYDVGFVLVFSDIHLWASIFSVILVNYIFMDGKCDYFQGTALVAVYLIILALYYFAPSPRSC
ncbi:cation/H+ exchanger protein 1 isoform X1 [Austrofundulus limnaeus]|uniref:Cation/H+ exchanger protein 1 isoform X1 n=1 Tax=Austrofundulus limnaeus TaxID=52670 RepID=A0A2I4D9K3_AUSLI|nr:PREDICTED: low affinity vacuolar monovalent cation/H(+) antiporter-like isoform X1 [Austrofundulus limnaeus]